ncbi:MAG: formate dehydrogenase subunit alpha [Anaerolineae bacterium]|jgi:formate dehydrogenase major subunit
MNKSLVPTICPYCGAGCALTVVVKDGQAVGLEYPTEHPVSQGALCAKGNAALEVLDHPDRLTAPLIKENGRFREAAWDEALDLIGERLSEIRDASGANTLGFLASAKCSNEENYFFQKLARSLGTNNVDHCARLCHAPTVVGLAHSLGSAAMTNPLPDLAQADCIFIVGSNLAANHPTAARWLWQAKDRGAKIIVADPRLTPTAWLADLFLQLRPGSDVALLNGMMHVVVNEGLADRDFVARRTTGFEALARHVQGYPPARAAELTGVPEGQIVAAARAYAAAPASTLVYCMGITQHTTGSDNVLACADLALLCGQIGRSGAGLMPLRGQNNVQGACDMGALPNFLPGYHPVDDPGLTVVEMMHAAEAGEVRALYIMGENPVVSDPNSDQVRAALAQLDFLVVQDIFMTETAALADVVLSAAAWAEKSGSYTTTERRVQWSHKAIDPPGQAHPDWQILSNLVARLALPGLTMPDSPKTILSEINHTVSLYAGITPERLIHATEGIFWPCPTVEHPGTPILHTERFATADGRARLQPVQYVTPAEQAGDALPLTLTTGRLAVHYNSGSMTRRSPSLQAQAPALFVELSPADAARLGLNDGETTQVRTARGRATAQVRVTDTVGDGVAFMPFHFEGTNRLTADALDPQAKIPAYKVSACQVEPERRRER